MAEAIAVDLGVLTFPERALPVLKNLYEGEEDVKSGPEHCEQLRKEICDLAMYPSLCKKWSRNGKKECHRRRKIG